MKVRYKKNLNSIGQTSSNSMEQMIEPKFKKHIYYIDLDLILVTGFDSTVGRFWIYLSKSLSFYESYLDLSLNQTVLTANTEIELDYAGLATPF